MVDESTLVEERPRPHLVVKPPGRPTHKVVLLADLSIGRAADNTLTLVDAKVSRHHARIARQGSDFSLTDLGSANGTMLNGVRLGAPHTLRHGDKVVIGDTQISYQDPARASQDGSPAPGAAPAKREKRSLMLGLVLVVAVLLLILGGVGLFLLVPDLLERVGLASTATATPAGVAVTPVTSVRDDAGPASSTDSPVATPAATIEIPNPAAADATPAIDQSIVDEVLLQADALTRRSKFEESIVIYEELARQDPRDARSQVGWAWALILDDRADEALPHAQTATELDPESADAASVLARAYIETGDKALALEAARVAVQLDPGNAQAHAALAEALMLDGKLPEAIEEADLALVQDIQNADAHRIRGWLYYAADNDLGRAAGELQSAAGVEPELWLRRHELGALLLNAEDYSTAILAFQDALGILPKAVTYTAIGEAYFRLAQYDQAKASLQQALAEGAEDLDTLALMAATCAHRGQCDDAKPYIEMALDIDPSDLLALEAQDICTQTKPSPTPSTTTAAASSSTPATTPEVTREAPTATATKPPAPPAALSGRIAFPVWNAEARQYDTYVAQVDGSERQPVVGGMHQPAFSPNGEWLAVKGEKSDQRNLFVVRPDGTELRKITEFHEDNLPSWAPNNTSLVLATTRDQPGRPRRLYVLDSVPTTRRTQQGRLLAAGDKPVQGEYPNWMPNDQIVFKGCDYTLEPQQCGLYTISSAGGPWTKLTDNGEDSAPAGFGEKIAFMSTRDGNWEIYSINQDGTGLRRLTNDPAHDGLPTWAPDGKTIAFVANRGGTWAVWAMSPNGSNQRKLFDIGEGGLAQDWQKEQISWAP